MITILQGLSFTKEVAEAAQMILFNGVDKYIISSIEQEGHLVLYANEDQTKELHSGRYSYQIIGATSLIEEGSLKVKANLLYSTDIASYWKKVLKQIDERLAGKAIDPANEVSVGDKKIRILQHRSTAKAKSFRLAENCRRRS